MSATISTRPTTIPERTDTPRLGYLPALDGLRALAVLAVLFYHANVLWLPGGFLGVEIFFVVSGYLITALLRAEYRAHQSINLKQFWARRARRLLPALFAMLGAVLVYAVIFLPDEVASLRGDVVAAFTYITNWYLIAEQKSYFEEMGRPSLLRHLWSLAVEEQFYLLWPLIFAFLLTRLKSRAAMLVLMFGAVVSAVWMGFLFQPDTDPSRVYYGTDTRAAGLLIGAALAFVSLPRLTTSRARRWLLDLLGVAALGGLIAICLTWSEFDAFLYQGGMILVAALTALVIASIVAPSSPLFATVLGVGVLRWIGLRSYALYLWHWPIFMVTRPQLDTALDGTPLLVLRFALTFALAEISYRLVEKPIRTGVVGNAWNQWNTSHGARRWGLGLTGAGVVGALLVGIFLLGNSVIHARAPQEPEFVLSAEEEIVSAEENFLVTDEPEIAQSVADEEATASTVSGVSFLFAEEAAPRTVVDPLLSYAQDSWLRQIIAQPAYLRDTMRANQDVWHLQRVDLNVRLESNQVQCNAACETRNDLAETKPGVFRPAIPTARSAIQKPVAPPAKPVVTQNRAPVIPLPPRTGPAPILAVGDSVMLGATHYFRRVGLDVDVDAKIGRQVSAAIKLLRERKDANLLAPIVIVHLGNNGTFTAKQFDELMTVLHDVPRVIFLNTKVPRKWQEPNNSALAAGVQKYPNAVLMDWNGASYEHKDWFWKDGIHLRPEGASEYANLIAQVVNQQ